MGRIMGYAPSHPRPASKTVRRLLDYATTLVLAVVVAMIIVAVGF